MLFLIILSIYIFLGIIIISILEKSSGGFLPTPNLMFFVAVLFWLFIVYSIASEYIEYWWKHERQKKRNKGD